MRQGLRPALNVQADSGRFGGHRFSADALDRVTSNVAPTTVSAAPGPWRQRRGQPSVSSDSRPATAAGSARPASARRRSARRSASGSGPRRTAGSAPRARARDSCRAAAPTVTPLVGADFSAGSSRPNVSTSVPLSPSPSSCGASSDAAWWARAVSSASSTSSTLSSRYCGQLLDRGRAPVPGAQPLLCLLDLDRPLLRAAGHVDRPAEIAEVALELAEDRRHGERRECVAATASKRSIALTRPRLATCSRSSNGSRAPLYRRASLRASGRKRSTSSSRARAVAMLLPAVEQRLGLSARPTGRGSGRQRRPGAGGGEVVLSLLLVPRFPACVTSRGSHDSLTISKEIPSLGRSISSWKRGRRPASGPGGGRRAEHRRRDLHGSAPSGI